MWILSFLSWVTSLPSVTASCNKKQNQVLVSQLKADSEAAGLKDSRWQASGERFAQSPFPKGRECWPKPNQLHFLFSGFLHWLFPPPEGLRLLWGHACKRGPRYWNREKQGWGRKLNCNWSLWSPRKLRPFTSSSALAQIQPSQALWRRAELYLPSVKPHIRMRTKLRTPLAGSPISERLQSSENPLSDLKKLPHPFPSYWNGKKTFLHPFWKFPRPAHEKPSCNPLQGPSSCSVVWSILGPTLELVNKPLCTCIGVGSLVVSQIRNLGHNNNLYSQSTLYVPKHHRALAAEPELWLLIYISAFHLMPQSCYVYFCVSTWGLTSWKALQGYSLNKFVHICVNR